MIHHQFLSETKSTVRLAIPIVIAQLGVVLMGVADNIMIGRMIGKNALGAAGLANSVAFLMSSIAIGGLPVVSPLIAKSVASGNFRETKATYLATIRVAFIFCLAVTVLGVILFINFGILGQTQSITEVARIFFLILIGSALPLFFFTAFKQLSDGLSLPRVAMYITFIGLAANVVFNFVFIKQFGVQGAAWATLGVRLIMAVVMGFYIFNSHIFKHITKVRTSPKRIKELTGQILKLSVPGGLQFFFEIGAFSFAVVMMGWISENALAAHQIAINIAATTYMMASGIAYAGSIRVGNSLGHKSITGVKVAGNSAFMLVFVFMTLAALLIFVFRHQLVQVYIRNEEIEALAVGLLFIAAFFQLSDGIQVVALGVLRGVSDVNVPAVITFIAYWIIALPLGYVLAFYTPLEAQGIWIALLSGLSFAAIFLTLRFYRKISRNRFKKGSTLNTSRPL